MVLKTTFGQSQRWSLIRGTLGVENQEKNNLNFSNKVFNGKDVLILGGRNSGIFTVLYMNEFFGQIPRITMVHRSLFITLFIITLFWI